MVRCSISSNLVFSLLSWMLFNCGWCLAADPVPAIDQGWQPGWQKGQTQWFHHASQGTMLVPYDWFMALEQPALVATAQPRMFSDPDYLSQFGFLRSQVDPRFNPGNLPIGFAIANNWSDPNQTTPSMPIRAVGLTCAACHTSQINYQGTTLRIEGGSAMINLGEFQQALGQALLITNSSSAKFKAFAARWFASQGLPSEMEATATARLKEALEVAVAKGMQERLLEAELGLSTVEAGFGRTDALSRIGNRVFGKLGAMNLTDTSAPVNFPHIWDTPWFYWVQYNASIRLPMVRNIGEALGVGAAINAQFESTVDVKNLHLMEDQLAGEQPFEGLKAPAWPEKVLGEIQGFQQGDGLWKQGKQLYEQHCIHCHYRVEDYQHAQNLDATSEHYKKYWSQPNQFGRKFMKLPFINFEDMGTDRAAVTDFYKRIVYTGSLGVEQSTLSAVDAMQMATAKVRERAFAKLGLSAADYAAYDAYRELSPEPAAIARLDYKARPLDGIWATAPFLHNGSVANLYELLLPAAQRMKSFYVGSTEFDPQHVGFNTNWAAGHFRIDTTLPGNLNTGHEFRELTPQEKYGLTPFQRARLQEQQGWAVYGVVGPELSDAERWALIEYVKSLGSPQLGQECQPAGESEAIAKLAQLQALLQTLSQQRVGHGQRGQHPKSHGTVKASFTIADNLPARYKLGIFSQPRSYEAVIRFSNGESYDDRKPDIHGMAIKVFIPSESDPQTIVEQDFLLADHPVFFAANVQHLLQFLIPIMSAADEPTRAAIKQQLESTTHPAYAGFKNELNTSPLEAQYWSQTPYRLGDLAVKYSVVPSQVNAIPDEQAPPVARDMNFLSKALAARLTAPNPPAVFDFCIQKQTDALSMPIEDATVEWTSASIKLATIRIDPQEINAEQNRPIDEYRSFSPWNALDEHRPIGGINRARRTIYAESQELRHQTNQASGRAPAPN